MNEISKKRKNVGIVGNAELPRSFNKIQKTISATVYTRKKLLNVR